MRKEDDPQRINFLLDRLYGKIEFTEDDLKLFQTRELARLRQVSLSAIPTWTLPCGICATKFEHSVGVGHLAKIVGSRPEFTEVACDLYFAALAHDLGTPPFSHASERFQIKLLGKSHEDFLGEIIEDSEFAREVERQGGSIERIVKLVKGEDKPWGDLVNGTIDIDNLDNTLRYGLSMGLFQDRLYSPENLARTFAIRDGKLALVLEQDRDLVGWEQCRRIAYEFVYSSANLSPGTMLYRALDFAAREGELSRDYFFMTDSEAFSYLERNCNPKTRVLVERIKRWMFYPQVFSFTEVLPSDSENSIEELFDSSEARSVLADTISQHLKVPPEEVAVYTGKNRGFKKIHLPLIDGKGEEKQHLPANQLTWMVQVYVHPKLTDRIEEIREFVKERLKKQSMRG